MTPSFEVREPTCGERPAGTGTGNGGQSRAITVVGRENPVKGLPPRRMWADSEEASHPHSLESSKLDLGVQKAQTAKPGRTSPGFGSRCQGSTTSPHGFPCKGTNTLDDRARWGGKTTLVPELAENLAVNEKSSALKGTRPCAKLVGNSTHRGKKGLPILLHSLRRAEQVKTQHPDGRAVVVYRETRLLDPRWCDQ